MIDDTIRAMAHDPGVRVPARREAEDDDGALRVLPTLAGSALVLAGLRRRGGSGRLAALAGVGLLAHGILPVLRQAIVREGAARRVFELDMTMTIDRPVPVVFAFCTDFSNFPSLVRALDEVQDSGDGRSHWIVHNVDGSIAEWDAMVTKFVPNQVIAWESDASAAVESRGVIRFRPLDASRTELSIHLYYAPKRTTLREAWRALLAPPRGGMIEQDLSLMSQRLDQYDPTVEPDPPEPMLPEPDAPAREST